MPRLELEDTSLFYNVNGEGPPIVFIHPPTLTSATFDGQVEELSKSYKVITFDIRGHGKSEASSKPITYRLIVEDILQILDHLQIEKTFLCGYSTGGSIVLEYILNSPERAFGGIVIGGMSDVRDSYLRNKISVGEKLANAGAIPLVAAAISWSNSADLQHFKRLYKEAIRGNPRNIEEYYRYSLFYNCTNLLEKIDLPILLVFGEKDTPFHAYANLLHQRISNNELVYVSGVDHRIPSKKARQLNSFISQFIKKNQALPSY